MTTWISARLHKMDNKRKTPMKPQNLDSSSNALPAPDMGDGTYRNPVIHADYSDPDAIRDGEDYYLVSSSFNCTPGLPILHSQDLVNWTIINHAIKNLPHPRYADVQHGQGVWAPAIRKHAGKFWIVFPLPDEGIYVTTADHPGQTWSEPHLLIAGKGLIDPCPFWDDDGQAYLAYAYAGSRAGIRNKIHLRAISPDATRVLDAGKIVTEIAEHLPALEGPKIYKRNGWYYIFTPAGGVATGWQTVFRSRNIYGPFEKRIVLAQSGTPVNGPHQGALVDEPNDQWWFLHFQDANAYGRIVHLQPVRWENDWPLIGTDQDKSGVGKPVFSNLKPKPELKCPIQSPQTSDDFLSKHLGLQWQWHANHHPDWFSLSARPGHLRLYPQFVLKLDFLKAGNLLLQKFPARDFSAETELELPAGHPSLGAGLIIMGMEYAALHARRNADGYHIRLVSTNHDPVDFHLVDSHPRLAVKISEGGICRFGVILDNRTFHQIGPAFCARPGRWIGAKIGIYCLSESPLDLGGFADFSHFQIGRDLFQTRQVEAGHKIDQQQREAVPLPGLACMF